MKRQNCALLSLGGFVLIELGVVIVMVGLMLTVWSALLSKAREKAHIAIDLSNMRQILGASAIYSSENNDHLAHPTWGGDLTGPDGWAYLTSKKSRPVPGALTAVPPSCAGRDVNSAQFTNQLAFFKAGQVTQYLPDVKTAWCPKDEATRGSGRLKQLWLARPVKVTSYTWNGTIGGYAGRAGDLGGKTYKVSQFLPGDWQMWEKSENDGFYFNDAASNPEGDPPSMRHSGAQQWWTLPGVIRRNYAGGLVVGTFGGSGNFVGWPKVFDLVNRKVPVPNALLNGPEYQR